MGHGPASHAGGTEKQASKDKLLSLAGVWGDLDADWVISFLRGRADAVELIGKLADEGIAVSIIT